MSFWSTSGDTLWSANLHSYHNTNTDQECTIHTYFFSLVFEASPIANSSILFKHSLSSSPTPSIGIQSTYRLYLNKASVCLRNWKALATALANSMGSSARKRSLMRGIQYWLGFSSSWAENEMNRVITLKNSQSSICNHHIPNTSIVQQSKKVAKCRSG